MEFTLNRETKTVTIIREFAAGRDLVWEAWTNPEIIDQWWAPAPLTSRTESMDFKIGGRRLYVMITPQGDRWGAQDFTAINPKDNFCFVSSFTDENGNPNPQFGTSDWIVNFNGDGNNTTVNIVIKRDNLEELEALIEAGFKTGFISALENLEQYLNSKK